MDPKSSDCYTQEETLKFDNPKKKKSYRKREKLDFDAIEAEAKSAGLDIGDLEDEQERKRAFDASPALPKADEASKALLPHNNSTDESAETSEKRFVFSAEMDLWSLELNETVKKLRKPDAHEDLFVEKKVESEVIKEDVVKDNTAPVKALHEEPVGKSMTGVLHFLRDRGSLKKKKSEDDGAKEIQILRKDEFGSDLTQKEAWRKVNYGFHGKEPGKKKQEKRRRKNDEKRMMEQIGSSETPSVKRMKQITAKLGTPYILL